MSNKAPLHFSVAKPSILNPKYQMKDSIDILAPKPSLLIPDALSSPSRKYFKKSTIYELSGILHRWNKKEFVLNLFNSSLLIRKKRKETLLYLKWFIIRDLGRFKKKWSFVLEPKVSSSEDPKAKGLMKKHIIGCDQKEVYDEWLGLLTQDLQVILEFF